MMTMQELQTVNVFAMQIPILFLEFTKFWRELCSYHNSARVGCDSKSIFNQRLTGLNSVFIFLDWFTFQDLRFKFALLFTDS